MVRRSIRISSYIMLPLMVGLALVAEPFVKLLLTDKWLPCVPFIQITCVVFAFRPIHTANLQVIKAMGRSDIFLKLEIIKKTIGIVVLCGVMRFGVIAIAVSGIFTTALSTVINAGPNRKLLGYSYIEQIKDLLNPLIPILGMIIAIWAIGFIPASPLTLLCIQIPIGATSYVLVSWVTRNESFKYSVSLVKSLVKKK